jgi:glycosyltransferase involved in cell wall biosynthesis
MKLYINREPIRGPWGGGAKFINSFHEHIEGMGHQLLGDSMKDVPDAILLAGLDNNGGISAEQAIMYKLYNPNVKVILRVNENDARKGTSNVDAYLLKLAPHVDGTVFVSHWLKNYFEEKSWPKTNSTVIINGVDKEIFKPYPKLNNGKLNIAAHHWSDHALKGTDIYEELDKFVGENSDKFAFTYIGRHKCNFKHTNVIRPLGGSKLAEELGKHDVYVSASRFDPGPNHVVEAIACGLPTYVHEDGGGAVEFAGVPGTYKNFDQLKDILTHSHAVLLKHGNANLFPHNAIALSTWQECIQEYNRFLESTCQATNK